MPDVPPYDHQCLRSLKLSRGLGARAGRRKPAKVQARLSNLRHLSHPHELRIGAAEPITTRPLRRFHRLKHYLGRAGLHLGRFLDPCNVLQLLCCR